MSDFFNSFVALDDYGLLEMLLPYVAPALTVILIGYLWYGSSRIRVPAMLPGLPLISIPILLQAFLCVRGVLRTFQEIATQKTSGIRAVAEGLAGPMAGLSRTVATSIGCILLLLCFQLAYDRHKSLRSTTERSKWAVSKALTFWSLGSFLATTALLLFLENTIDLIFLAADKNRLAEGQRRFAQMGIDGIEGLSSLISHHLVLTAFLPLLIVPLLFPLAQYLLQSGEVSAWIRVSSWVSAALAVLGLVSVLMLLHHEIRYALSLIPAD